MEQVAASKRKGHVTYNKTKVFIRKKSHLIKESWKKELNVPFFIRGSLKVKNAFKHFRDISRVSMAVTVRGGKVYLRTLLFSYHLLVP